MSDDFDGRNIIIGLVVAVGFAYGSFKFIDSMHPYRLIASTNFNGLIEENEEHAYTTYAACLRGIDYRKDDNKEITYKCIKK